MNFTVPAGYTNQFYSTVPNGTIFYPTVTTIPYTSSPSITLSQNTYDPRFNPLFMSPSVVHCQSPRNNIVYSPTAHSLPAPTRRLSAETTNEDQLPPPPPVWRSSPIHHRNPEPPPPPPNNFVPPPPPYRSSSPSVNIEISPQKSPFQPNWDVPDSPPNPYFVAPTSDHHRRINESPSPIPSGQSDTSPETWGVRDPQRVLDDEYSPPYVPQGATFTSPPEATWGPDRGFGTTRRQRRRTSSSDNSSPPPQDESCGLTETSPSEVTETSSCPPDFTPHEDGSVSLALRVIPPKNHRDPETNTQNYNLYEELTKPHHNVLNVSEKRDYNTVETIQTNITTTDMKSHVQNADNTKSQITNHDKSHQLSSKDLAFLMLNKKLQETENEAAALRAQLEALRNPMPSPQIQMEEVKIASRPIVPPLALPPMAPHRTAPQSTELYTTQQLNAEKRWNPDTKVRPGRRSSSPTISPRFENHSSTQKRSSSPTIANKKLEVNPLQGKPTKQRSSSPGVKHAPPSNVGSAKRSPSPSYSINSARNSARIPEKQHHRSTSPQQINKSTTRPTAGIKSQRASSISSTTPRSHIPTPRAPQNVIPPKHTQPSQNCKETENADQKWKRKAPVPRLSVMVRRAQSPSTRVTPKDIQEVNVISPSPCSASLLSLPSVDPAAEVADWAARVEMCGMEGVLLDDTPLSSTCPVIPHPPPLPRLPNYEPPPQATLQQNQNQNQPLSDLSSEIDEEEKLREKLQLKLQLERQLQLQLQEHQQLQMRLQLEEVRQKLRSLQQPPINEHPNNGQSNEDNSFSV